MEKRYRNKIIIIIILLLLLPEVEPLLATFIGQAGGQAVDEVTQVSLFQCMPQLLVLELLERVQVEAERPREQHRVLGQRDRGNYHCVLLKGEEEVTHIDLS